MVVGGTYHLIDRLLFVTRVMDDGGRGSHLQIFADHEILAKGFQALNMPAHIVEEKEKGRSKRAGQKEGVVKG